MKLEYVKCKIKSCRVCDAPEPEPINIYWYEIADDYVFGNLFNDEWCWALSDRGKIWYQQTKTKKFELMGEM